MHVQKYTEDYRQAELEQGQKSLFYFAKAILGFDLFNEEHYDLCSFLEGRAPHYPWSSAIVTVYRGGYKSSAATQAYPLWRCCYIDDFAVKIIENSSDNAKFNHFMPMLHMWTTSRRADYLQWLFQERLPDGMTGWSNTQIQFKRNNPLGPPSITYWGLESKFEGWHGDLVILDDPEGGEAEKSRAANEESWRTWGQIMPLARYPERFQRLGVMTPHGQNPLCYRVLDAEHEGSPLNGPQPGQIDNEGRATKVYWKPLLDETGEVREKHRFRKEVVRNLQLNPDIWNTQYLLRRPTGDLDFFDFDQVETYAWDWGDLSHASVRYKARNFDEEGGLLEDRLATWPISSLRFFLHADPKHKTDAMRRVKDSKVRPSEAAIAVVAVAPDMNVLLWSHWTEDCGLDPQARELHRLYCRFEAHRATFEGIGAQIWFMEYVKSLEQREPHWAVPQSLGLIDGVRRALPRLSRRLVECENTNESKQNAYQTVLAAWLNSGMLHLKRTDEKTRYQLHHCMSQSHAVDILDCIVQGPPVWSAPSNLGVIEASRRYQARRATRELPKYAFQGNPSLSDTQLR